MSHPVPPAKNGVVSLTYRALVGAVVAIAGAAGGGGIALTRQADLTQLAVVTQQVAALSKALDEFKADSQVSRAELRADIAKIDEQLRQILARLRSE